MVYLEMDLPVLTKRQKFYLRHKNDEVFKEKNREQRRAYYNRNQEVEREKALARYYSKKALLSPPPAPAPAETSG